jgi:hypothetical protein
LSFAQKAKKRRSFLHIDKNLLRANLADIVPANKNALKRPNLAGFLRGAKRAAYPGLATILVPKVIFEDAYAQT